MQAPHTHTSPKYVYYTVYVCLQREEKKDCHGEATQTTIFLFFYILSLLYTEFVLQKPPARPWGLFVCFCDT